MRIFDQPPEIHVGILCSGYLEFIFHGPFLSSMPGANEKKTRLKGTASALIEGGRIILRQEGHTLTEGTELIITPVNILEGGFGISEVLIGKGFHWEQKEQQHFPGALKLMQVNGEIQAVNLVSVEQYLASVIASEMRADCSPALLMAHTIISRSWLLAQIEKRSQLDRSGEPYESVHETEEEYVRWYDREDHQGFDVCADDHCQRYQGISRAGNPEVLKAVNQTMGEVLVYGDDICDARFSKCCGGVVEEFQHVWESRSIPYLKRVDDNPAGAGINVKDLKVESNARAFISGAPEAFCNTRDKDLLAQVLNDYDQATFDFYRWEVSYRQVELSRIIREKSGYDFGEIIDLLPLQRGESGRLVRLKIVGSKKTMVVAKELEIRRWLSPSHLYSAAFIVEKKDLKKGIPQMFKLRGAGWGHGVGLCQIGAAVMAHKSYAHGDILKHYFKGAIIKKLYE